MRAWLLCLLVACSADELEPGYYVSYDVYMNGEVFDRLHVTLTHELGFDIRDRPAPITPGMLANGVAAPTSYELYDMIQFDDPAMEPTHYFHVEAEHALWHWGGLHVLAFYNNQLVGGGLAQLTLVNHGNRHWVATGSLELKRAVVELWGVARTDGGPAFGPCIRMAGDVVKYVVREIDTDCDMIWDTDDCQPSAYCDPATPSSPTCSCAP
jgi:hypothetical protein